MAWPRYKDTKEVMQEALVEKQLEQLKEDEIRLKQLEALARRATPVVDKIPESGPLREWMDKFLEEEVDHKGRHYPGSRHFKEGKKFCVCMRLGGGFKNRRRLLSLSL